MSLNLTGIVDQNDPVLQAMLRDRATVEQFEYGYGIANRRAEVDSKGYTGTGPEVVPAGSEAHVNMEFSYSNDAGKDKREIDRVREALAYGKLMPIQIVDHGTHIERRFPSHHWVEALAEGRACIRCGEAPFETEHEQRDQHEKLSNEIRRSGAAYEYNVPDDVMNHCGYCGAKLQGSRAA